MCLEAELKFKQKSWIFLNIKTIQTICIPSSSLQLLQHDFPLLCLHSEIFPLKGTDWHKYANTLSCIAG